jgi:hypothetical protein
MRHACASAYASGRAVQCCVVSRSRRSRLAEGGFLQPQALAHSTPPPGRWDVVKGFKKKGADSIRGVYLMVATRKLKGLDLRAQAPALYKYLHEEAAA